MGLLFGGATFTAFTTFVLAGKPFLEIEEPRPIFYSAFGNGTRNP